MTEIFKDIVGYEEFYQISNLGNVYSKKRKRNLKPLLNNRGYCRVGLYKKGERKTMFVHRLIALHFIENPQNKPCIDHINRVRTDNRLENLRWATHTENSNNITPYTRSFKTITKGGYSKTKWGYKYQWYENKIDKSKHFKTLELAKAFQVEHLKKIDAIL
tara:strand:+ start:592 stop:1074 length:483 start_codon:yes stop_codon:yes gene_type:complete